MNYEDCNCLDGSGNEVEVGDYLNFPCMIGFILKQCRGNNTCFCSADGVFPAGREVSHVFDGLIPATSFLHDRVPHSRSGQC